MMGTEGLGESVSELMIGKKKLQETVHSTLLLGCFLPAVHVVF